MTTIHPSRSIHVILVTILFLCCALAQNRDDRYGQILTAIQNSDFDHALDLLRPALAASPGNAELLAMRGFAYAGKGNKKEALASFQSALKKSPENYPALKGAIQLQFESADLAAIPLLQRMLRLHPEDSTSHAMLAILDYQQGNCAAAVPHFEKAGAAFDTQRDGLHAYATCLVKLKQPEKGAAIFQRALALNPNDHRERRLLASIQLMAHQPENALATLGPLLQESNPEVETLELASTAYEATKDTPQAVETLRRAILLEPTNTNLYLDFANLSYAHASFQVGVNVVSDGIGIQPKAPPLYFARGVLYVQLGQFDNAESDFAKAYELDPNQSLSVAAQSLAAAQQNDFERALAKVKESLARKPNDAFMLYLQADILAEKGPDPGSPEFQLAMRSARKSVELQPALGPARGVLANLYLQSGKYSEAAEECRKALASNPKDQAAVYHLIQALRKTGKNAEIPELLKRLALLRQQAAKSASDRYQYKLVEDDEAAPKPAQP